MSPQTPSQHQSSRTLQAVRVTGDDLTHPLFFFNRVYIINLASREDRRKEMRDQLKRIGVGMTDSNVEQRCPSTRSGCVLIQPTDAVGCSHFLALRAPAISIAVAHLDAMSKRASGDILVGPMHVDGAYRWVRRSNPELNTFVANPELGYQRSSCSDIYKIRWFDRLPILKVIVAALRKLRNF